MVESYREAAQASDCRQFHAIVSARLTNFVSLSRLRLQKKHYKGSSQPHSSLVWPLNSPKNASCSLRVTGPQPPLPMIMWSTWRTGVTSAAVPVMKISSAAYKLLAGNRDFLRLDAELGRPA